jgi:predicted sulfurtransferase
VRLLTEARDAQVRGGIERYLRTFPQGGHWKGKNYLFDRRFEQQPEGKSDADLQKDVESWCAVCGEPWDLCWYVQKLALTSAFSQRPLATSHAAKNAHHHV